MIKKTVTYTDYKGVERTEDFYFNLTKAEITMMELSTQGGLQEKISRIVEKQDGAEIIAIITDLIAKAYGEKSVDGRQFIKSKELSDAFSFTPAYDVIFMELVTNPENAAAFFNGVVPQMAETK